MQFIYILIAWEGSTANGRVLREALHKTNGLNVLNDKSITRNKYVVLYVTLMSWNLNISQSYRSLLFWECWVC